MSRVVVVGAGINGVTAAIDLRGRGHHVVLVDPGPLPHPLAASTDISKAVRAAYGADEEYTELAECAIKLWRKWNKEFGLQFYHEVGVMFVCQREMKPGDFEIMATGAWTPYQLPFMKEFFRATGQPVFHLKPRQHALFAAERFPVFGADITTTGYYGFPLNHDGVVKIANHGPGREMSPDSPERLVTP